MKVYVLQIGHKHGTNLTVHQSESGARDQLYGFVELWWDNEMEPIRPAGRHIWTDGSGMEWLVDPETDSDTRLKDLNPEHAAELRRLFPAIPAEAPPIPADRDEAIEAYFEATSHEDWQIEETEVLP